MILGRTAWPERSDRLSGHRSWIARLASRPSGGRRSWQDAATVTEHVRRVRHKIEPDPSNPRWIRGVRNAGYSFDPS
jgi:Transcriptional regulatory protein, C terminal